MLLYLCSSNTHSETYLIIEKCLQVGFTSINASSILWSHHQNQINRINLTHHIEFELFVTPGNRNCSQAEFMWQQSKRENGGMSFVSVLLSPHRFRPRSKSDSNARSSTHQGDLRQFQLKSTSECNKLHDLFSKGFADFNPSFSTS